MTVGFLLLALVVALVPAPAAAHDNNCTVASHIRNVKVHYNCEHDRGWDSSECILTVNVESVHLDIAC